MYSLRELERRDIKEINLWRNDREIIDNLGAPFRFINTDTDESWYNSYMSNRSNNIRCSIINKAGDVIGLVSLTNIDRINGVGTLHIMIGNKDSQGKGAGFYAVSEIVKHAFMDMNLRRIELSVLETNIKAQNLYKKIGFSVEGIKKEAVYKNGQYHNVIMMALLKTDWLN